MLMCLEASLSVFPASFCMASPNCLPAHINDVQHCHACRHIVSCCSCLHTRALAAKIKAASGSRLLNRCRQHTEPLKGNLLEKESDWAGQTQPSLHRQKSTGMLPQYCKEHTDARCLGKIVSRPRVDTCARSMDGDTLVLRWHRHSLGFAVSTISSRLLLLLLLCPPTTLFPCYDLQDAEL